jgi:4-hydroxybenzoate polyprenyltransferase
MVTTSALPVASPALSAALAPHPERPAVPLRLGTLRLAWEEARPVVQIVFLLRFLTGLALVERDAGILTWSILAGAGSWSCVTASIYVLNGVSDVAGDRANGSTRPIASGRLPVDTALWTAVALATAGVALSAAVRGPAALLAVLMLALGWAYSMARNPLKKSMPGFMAVVTAGGLLTYLAGWVSVGERPNRELLVFGLAMSLWMGLGGSTKDLSDTDGDRAAGRRTWPVILGERKARIAMAASACTLGCGFFAAATRVAPGLVASSVVVLAGSVTLVAILLTPLSSGNQWMRRRPYRMFMVTQYVAHLTLLGGIALQFH